MIRRVITTALMAGALAPLATTLPGPVPCCELRYRVRPVPESRAIEVALDLHGFEGDSLILARASDRPLIGLLNEDPEVAGVRRGRWSLVDGAPRWSFPRPPGGWDDRVRIRYRLGVTAERPFNAWSVGMASDLLYAPAAALFLVPELPEQRARHAPIRVRWSLPADWTVMAGWESDAFHGARTLVKTNVLAGEIVEERASVCGLEVALGVHGEWDFAPDTLASDLASLACAARLRLGGSKVERYMVTLVRARFPVTSGNRNGPRSIGFVHRSPDGSPPPTRLLAHEIVHLWQRFDAPTWFQEGVNDYMAVRLAREAGLLDEEAYLERFATIDSIYRAHPKSGEWTFAQEAREAPPFGSSDTYLAYRKGAIVGLALDRELRLRTGGRADLAALWREMNARAAWGKVAWTDAEISARAASLAGGGFGHFFDLYVEGTTPLPPSKALLANLPPPADPVPRGGFATVAPLVRIALALAVSHAGTPR
ncbi:MAG: hypothetical protein R3199_05905 [Gemmatimonadota bacterium]|nr:hypothetical protein [Gemmatimonadota bacterium]